MTSIGWTYRYAHAPHVHHRCIHHTPANTCYSPRPPLSHTYIIIDTALQLRHGELDSVRSHGQHLSPTDRLIIVKKVRGEGKSQHAVAAEVGYTQATVSRTLKHYDETGDVLEMHGGGAEHAYDETEMDRLGVLIDTLGTALRTSSYTARVDGSHCTSCQ